VNDFGSMRADDVVGESFVPIFVRCGLLRGFWNMKQNLGLYTHLLPQMAAAAADEKSRDDYAADYGGRLREMKTAVVFDCRSIPVGFLEDTGSAIRHEYIETGEKVILPYGTCYLEFDDESAALAVSNCYFSDAEISAMDDVLPDYDAERAVIDVFGFSGWGAFDSTDPYSDTGEHGIFTNGQSAGYFELDLINGEIPFSLRMNVNNAVAEFEIDRAMLRVLGVLGLLRDKLLIETNVPDPKPWATKFNLSNGKLPRSGNVRVLTVNVPAVRYSASRSVRNDIGTHASPSLHWRRGHWRMLHRGSEFEGRAWVRPCLVGDPDKGFVKSAYRLTNNQNMLNVA
jgi:hypothetical protein